MATVTFAGTFTALDMDVTKIAKNRQQQRFLDTANFERIKDTGHPELQLVVQGFADGYGIGYSAALALLTHLMSIEANRQSPTLAPGTRTATLNT